LEADEEAAALSTFHSCLNAQTPMSIQNDHKKYLLTTYETVFAALDTS